MDYHVASAFDGTGSLWVADRLPGPWQLARLDADGMSWTHYSSASTGGAMPRLGIGSMDVAPDRSIWYTYGQGVIRFVPGADEREDQWITYQDVLLSGYSLVHVAIDRNGSIWWVTGRDGSESKVILCAGSTLGD